MTAETINARELVAKLAAHVRPTCSELWDEAQAFLAARRDVQAGEGLDYDLAVLDDAAETLDRIGEGSAGLREARARIASALSQQPSPSAPVEVDAPGSRAWMAEVCRVAALSLAAHGVRNDQLSKVADWIAQQPAAEPRSTHRVWRRNDWLSCYCEALSDHRIGCEQQPKARSVVDITDEMVERAAHCIPGAVPTLAKAREVAREILTITLTGEHSDELA